jgi:hypothetical protein
MRMTRQAVLVTIAGLLLLLVAIVLILIYVVGYVGVHGGV